MDPATRFDVPLEDTEQVILVTLISARISCLVLLACWLQSVDGDVAVLDLRTYTGDCRGDSARSKFRGTTDSVVGTTAKSAGGSVGRSVSSCVSRMTCFVSFKVLSQSVLSQSLGQ